MWSCQRWRISSRPMHNWPSFVLCLTGWRLTRWISLRPSHTSLPDKPRSIAAWFYLVCLLLEPQPVSSHVLLLLSSVPHTICLRLYWHSFGKQSVALRDCLTYRLMMFLEISQVVSFSPIQGHTQLPLSAHFCPFSVSICLIFQFSVCSFTYLLVMQRKGKFSSGLPLCDFLWSVRHSAELMRGCQQEGGFSPPPPSRF